MRIGFIIYGSLDTLTGGYLYDRFVVEGLTGLGHEVEVISLPPGSYLRRLCSVFSQGLWRRLLAGGFDILIQDELCHPSLFLINKRLRRQADRPLLVALVHHVLCDEPRPRWRNMILGLVERSFLATVDGFIYNSETTRRTVASLFEHNRPLVIAYPAGDRFGSPLSAEVIAKRTHRPGPLELLFLGIVIPRKGLLPLLSALAHLDREVWRLSIAGGLDFDPAYTARAEKLIRELDLADSVRFLGPLQDGDLVSILSTSHLFCMPYAYEGFGIAILEAMAFGLPAIGCSNGAAHETISHGTNGFLLDPDDLAGLAPLLLQLHQDREQLQQMAQAACSTYCSRPKWQDSIEAIDTFLRKLRELPDTI
ncbi:glycosyltransferase family 4 protein [Desulforhopalus sp. IMCC35007]|uniref:glycosyltransferase family 4 protein n=1 Tax=Desulforhopalus sp. IMCC35007 TaxID=2569543 RepID=UPI0010ADFF2C|nr:glycosyltransferase family 4 protein [Desulforhopalus sp. IMCC35007]TKB06117.1 glycosyltransferase family 4 protein [Desulforhopalus sp. IMCC35007]